MFKKLHVNAFDGSFKHVPLATTTDWSWPEVKQTNWRGTHMRTFVFENLHKNLTFRSWNIEIRQPSQKCTSQPIFPEHSYVKKLISFYWPYTHENRHLSRLRSGETPTAWLSMVRIVAYCNSSNALGCFQLFSLSQVSRFSCFYLVLVSEQRWSD